MLKATFCTLGIGMMIAYSAHASVSDRLNITGYTVGMPLSQVQAHAPPGMLAIPLHDRDPRRSGVVYTRFGINRFGLDVEMERYVFTALDGRVYWIDHFIQFNRGQQPNYDELKRQTDAKYGRYGQFRDSLPVRQYNLTGDVVDPRDTQCGYALDTLLQTVSIQISASRVVNFGAPQRYGALCQPSVRVEINPDNENMALVQHLDVRAFDPRPMHDYLAGQAEAGQQQRDRDATKAKGRQTPL